MTSLNPKDLTMSSPAFTSYSPHPATSCISLSSCLLLIHNPRALFSSCQTMELFKQANNILLWETGDTPCSCYYKAHLSQHLLVQLVPECNPQVTLPGVLLPQVVRTFDKLLSIHLTILSVVWPSHTI